MAINQDRQLLAARHHALTANSPARPPTTSPARLSPGAGFCTSLVLVDRDTASRRTSGQASSLTGPEREIIRLLATGLTDESAAQHLGISPRTVRRHVTGLMSRLGARSRLELGVRLAHARIL